jgi:thiol-disulfide isomerase/thioredoxin
VIPDSPASGRPVPALRGRLQRLAAAAAAVAILVLALWQAGVLFQSDDSNTGAGVALEAPETSLDTPGADQATVGLGEGDLAPDFVFSSFDGTRVRLSDFRGRAVLLNFWATWCVPCRVELPQMDTLLQQYGDSRLAVLAINGGESASRASGYIRKLDIRLTAFGYDPKSAVARRYAVQGLPTSYFIDAQGVVTRVVAGQLTPRIMQSGVDEALGIATVH